eukprot:GHRR01027845.1.p1 GENE.GHRR01027845.1~~GHRR01027845.1.p1  ORF type:complete len:112 (-),score=25.06 GHRR01027845.1:29-364(-)
MAPLCAGSLSLSTNSTIVAMPLLFSVMQCYMVQSIPKMLESSCSYPLVQWLHSVQVQSVHIQHDIDGHTFDVLCNALQGLQQQEMAAATAAWWEQQQCGSSTVRTSMTQHK